MKKNLKKFLILSLFTVSLISFSACGSTKFDIKKHLIEKRENLFIASDNLYTVTFSTGIREKDYNLDGTINELIPFGVLTLSRIDSLPLANDNYTYVVKIDDKSYTGFLEKNPNDNSYSADLEVLSNGQETINAQVSFSGYSFNQDMTNVTKNFEVDTNSALKIAEKALKNEIKNITSNKNVKIEVVMKTVKDYSSVELKNYYWYVGIISTNGDTLGVLIDVSSGEIIAKKV